MKKQIIIAIACMASAFTFTGCLHTAKTAEQQDKQHPLQYTLRVTPEIKRAFHSDDSIKIRSITGTAPKFQTGGTYRVVCTCTQQTLKNATLYLGNTAEAGPEAIVASAGSSLFRPLPSGTTEFNITFTLLRPCLLQQVPPRFFVHPQPQISIITRLFVMGGTCAVMLAAKVSLSGHHAQLRPGAPQPPTSRAAPWLKPTTTNPHFRAL